MPDPAELLGVSRLLWSQALTSTRPDALIRRGVSTAYYALFHSILRTAADRFVGRALRDTAGYTILYRAFDHRRMKDICEDLQRSTLAAKYQRVLRRSAVSSQARDFVVGFPLSQEARHRADYDPSATLALYDLALAITGAEATINALDRIDEVEKADILTLVLVGLRTY